MNTKEPQLVPLTYRPDIDGLRAIAVLAVVFYHAFPNHLGGGFIGVDIFFVISGFLITSLLVNDLNNHQFSLTHFYSRRIRRLGPALLLMLICTYFIGLFFLQSDEFSQLRKHTLGGITFTSNIIFWREAGYFDNAAETKPLLHLWSLGIEEQFYLCCPFILFIFFKYKKINFGLWLSLITTLSFLSNVIFSYNAPVAAFFSLQSRFWEFVIGASLSISEIERGDPNNRPSKLFNNQKAIVGSVLIGLGIVLISSHSTFPGWWSLLPVIGSTLIISAGPNSYINQNILSNKKLVYIGLISYPLYLWHWPLLSIARILLSRTPLPPTRLGLVAIAFILAMLTYHLVERPIRISKINKGITPLILSVLSIFLIAVIWPQSYSSTKTVNSLIYSQDEFEAFYLPKEGMETLHRFENSFRHECNFYQVEQFYKGNATTIPKPKIDQSCYTPDGVSTNTVLIWGDSHAQMLNYGLSKNLPKDWQIFQIASSGCHPSIDFTKDSEVNYCARSNWFALKTIQDNKVKVVVVAQSVDHDAAQMNKIAAKLESVGVEKIVFLGSSPRWTDFLPRIVLRQLWPQVPNRTFIGVDKDLISRDLIVKRNFNNSKKRVFIDVIELFCNQEGCLTRVPEYQDSSLTSWDLGHLTQAASDFLAKKVLVDAVTGGLN